MVVLWLVVVGRRGTDRTFTVIGEGFLGNGLLTTCAGLAAGQIRNSDQSPIGGQVSILGIVEKATDLERSGTLREMNVLFLSAPSPQSSTAV